jgi:DNA-binding beta-propeller fold protein YncE
VRRPLQWQRLRVQRPEAISFDGTHLWITNFDGNSVTEITPSNGSLVQLLGDGSYGFNEPAGIAFDSTRLWVTNEQGNSVTEINAFDGNLARAGTLVRVVGGTAYGFNLPGGIAFDGDCGAGSRLFLPLTLSARRAMRWNRERHGHPQLTPYEVKTVLRAVTSNAERKGGTCHDD